MPLRMSASATSTAVITIPLGYKTIDAVKDAQRLSKTYGKAVMARISVELTTGTGLVQLNSAPVTMPIMLNLVYDRNDVHPATIAVYKTAVLNIKKQITHKVNIVCVENEELFHYYNTPDAMNLYAAMVNVNYQIWTPGGVTVATGGTSTQVSAGMTYRYYEATQGEAVAQDFLTRYVTQSGNYIKIDYADFAIQELADLKKYYMPKLNYPIHSSIRYSTIDYMPELISALQYYSKPFIFANTELSCMQQDPMLVSSAMNCFTGKVPYVVGYSRDMQDRTAVGWTSDMESAFMAYGK
jgi:hypothetical protein